MTVPQTGRGRQLRVVSRWMLASACIAALVFSLSACTVVQPTLKPTVAPSDSLLDPLVQITDPDSERFISANIEPVLHVLGTGPHSYSVEAPESYVKQVQFFLACAPESTFTVTMVKFYSGPCTGEYQNSGTIPVPDDGKNLVIEVAIPDDAEFWLVGIPIQ